VKKFILWLILLAFLITGCSYTFYGITPNQIFQLVHMKVTEKQNKNIESELIKIKQQEQEKEQRRLELLKLQNPEIINQQLRKTDKTICYEGTQKYSDLIIDKKWYGYKDLNIELYYDYGIGIDNSKLIVKDFYDDKVVIQIPKNQVKLVYISLNAAKSKIDGDNSILIEGYSPEDVKVVLETADSKTKLNINNDKNTYDVAFSNLKDNIKKKVLSLGYSDVVFEEI